MKSDSSKNEVDPAGVFAGALSIWNACNKQAEADPNLNLSEAYNGIDQLMRETMRVGEMFESSASRHVAFEEFSEVWPYFVEDHLGKACFEVISVDGLAGFDVDDCLSIACNVKLPLRVSDSMLLPVNLCIANPAVTSGFRHYQIQTVRDYLGEDGGVFPFSAGDVPVDENFGEIYFGLYGVDEDGLAEHIADRKTYSEVRNLALKIAPFAEVPDEVVYFPR